MAKYWITFDLKKAYIDLPDGLEGDELEAALEAAQGDVDLDTLVEGWDAGEVGS